MTPLQILRLHLGLTAEPSDEEVATEAARYARMREATPGEQSALRLRRLKAAGWDAQAHGNDPRRLAGSIGEPPAMGAGGTTAPSPSAGADAPELFVERRRPPNKGPDSSGHDDDDRR